MGEFLIDVLEIEIELCMMDLSLCKSLSELPHSLSLRVQLPLSFPTSIAVSLVSPSRDQWLPLSRPGPTAADDLPPSSSDLRY